MIVQQVNIHVGKSVDERCFVDIPVQDHVMVTLIVADALVIVKWNAFTLAAKNSAVNWYVQRSILVF